LILAIILLLFANILTFFFCNPFYNNKQDCLSYLDEKEDPPKWKCVDECLEKKGGMLCGSTDHFTSFAVLLGGIGGGGGGGGCGSSNKESSIYVYLSAAAIGFALFVICVGITSYEIFKRREKRKIKLQQRKLDKLVVKIQSSSS
jgi:hypothetical protein